MTENGKVLLAKGIRWSTVMAVLAFIVLLGNASGALERLGPWTPVLWGHLEAWTEAKLEARTTFVVQLEAKIANQLTEIQWEQVIYRTKDLEFQLSLLRDREFMLENLIQSTPAETQELDAFRQGRLRELREEIRTKTAELSKLVCQVENRGSNGTRCQ